ncbi:MAG: hypothetical protein ACYCTI_08715 [Acidimicrobiales bacterium]
MTDEPPLPPDMEVFYSDDPPGPRSRRLRILAAITLVALVAGAGLGFTFAGHSSTSPSVRRSAPPTTSPYALNNDPAPSLAGAYSDNLIVAFRALYAYANWLGEHPRPSLVSQYAVNGSPIYQIETQNMRYLIARHAHEPADPRGYAGDLQFVKVSLAPQPVMAADGRQVLIAGHPAFKGGLVTVVVQYLQSNLYTDSGQYLQPGQNAAVAALSYSLAQGADGRWRLYSVVGLHPAGGPYSVETAA